jgi:hypothetical protein
MASRPHVLLVKDGVQFAKIAPAGFRILAALDNVARQAGLDLTVTSACDGEHSGPNDPHHRGEAYDVRSHDLNKEQKDMVLDLVMKWLGTERFFGWLESPGSSNEHFHFQIKKGTTYP